MKTRIIVLLIIFQFLSGSFLSCDTGSVDPQLGSRVVNKLKSAGEFERNGNTKVYIAFRKDGLRVMDLWVSSNEIEKELAESIDKSYTDLRAQERLANSIEICIAEDFTEIPPRERNIRKWNMYRGIEGVEYTFQDNSMAFCPTRMIANNEGFVDTLRDYIKTYGYSPSILASRQLDLKRFKASQYIFFPSSDPEKKDDRLVEMFRGNQFIPLSEVTLENTRKLAEGMADWLVRNVQQDGRLVYKYWPSMGVESGSNNMIRQFMGTIAIGRWAEFKGDSNVRDKHNSNLRYNIEKFYKEDPGLELGYIEYNRKVKLGAASLAALSILESDIYEELDNKERMLRNLTFHLWKENGRFKTFYRLERDDNHNFYPGEALLYWSAVYSDSRDEKLLKMFMKSFEYYSSWHLRNRNPAFIPWHTQAYYNIWVLNKNNDLKDFIFEMNDWLIAVMQKDNNEYYRDFSGRFYSERPYYGPPHASSTGVYLEGLIDAYKLAEETGDEQRQEEYRRSILKGLRSVMQLQFTDAIDMYYISKRDMVKGGIRTTVYDNEIRVDNVQHNLMAVIKILEEFSEQDFYTESDD